MRFLFLKVIRGRFEYLETVVFLTTVLLTGRLANPMFKILARLACVYEVQIKTLIKSKCAS